jgi:transcriptional regulator
MYRPYFHEASVAVLHETIRRVRMGVVISHTVAGGLQASNIPLYLDASDSAGKHGTLYGHFAVANPQYKALSGATAAAVSEVLVVFNEADAYISPNWNPEKKQNQGKVVPTWNYITVQARGVMQFIDDEAELRQKVLEPLTDHNEAIAQKECPEGKGHHCWKVSDAPEPYLRANYKGIRGFRIQLTALDGAWKLSQNKTAATHSGLIEGLASQRGEKNRTVAEEMNKRLSKL